MIFRLQGGSQKASSMKRLLVLPLLILVATCAQATPEQQVIDEAAEALGGAERIRSLTALTIQGTGSAPNAGQNRTPDDELPVWTVNEFTRSVDLVNWRMRAQQVREAKFLFAGDPVQRQTQGLDGDAAYTVSANGTIARSGGTAGRDRRIEMLHHPIAIVKMALESDVTISNLQARAGELTVDIALPGGDTVTFATDARTHLPSRVVSKVANPNMGDVSIDTSFSDYQDGEGLLLPRRLRFTTTRSSATVNAKPASALFATTSGSDLQFLPGSWPTTRCGEPGCGQPARLRLSGRLRTRRPVPVRAPLLRERLWRSLPRHDRSRGLRAPLPLCRPSR